MKKVILALAFAGFAAAQTDFGLEYGNLIGLGANDPVTISVNVIKMALSFTAYVAMIIIIIGGFKWMTAGGNEDRAAEAKSTGWRSFSWPGALPAG